MVNKFEFPNDSPEEEIKRILLLAGLNESEINFLIACYKVELIEKYLRGLQEECQSQMKH